MRPSRPTLPMPIPRCDRCEPRSASRRWWFTLLHHDARHRSVPCPEPTLRCGAWFPCRFVGRPSQPELTDPATFFLIRSSAIHKLARLLAQLLPAARMLCTPQTQTPTACNRTFMVDVNHNVTNSKTNKPFTLEECRTACHHNDDNGGTSVCVVRPPFGNISLASTPHDRVLICVPAQLA
eukprot:SAG11_NODE_134_length_15338_cov_3.876435_18_plen_180_part_00